MKKLILLLIFLMPLVAQGALTKTENTEAMAWTSIVAASGTTGIKETGSIDCSDSYSTTLHIDVCIAEASAHEGTEVIIQVNSEAGTDGQWTTLTRFLSNAVTGVKADMAGAEAAGQTTLSVTNPTTAGFDWPGKMIFIVASTTTSCEIAYQINVTGDATDTIEILNGLDHAQDAATDIFSVDAVGFENSAVNTWAVTVPFSVSQANVIINNWYDADGTAADVYGRVRVTKATGL